MNSVRPAWIGAALKKPDGSMEDAARARQAQLTKPPGALGMLEDVAIRMAALQSRCQPRIQDVHIAIFAGDHGVAAEGISAFPQAVTAEMIRNFARGGAAISVLAMSLETPLQVIDLGTVCELSDIPGVTHRRLGPGTANFVHAPAMDTDQCSAAMDAGRHCIEQAGQIDLFIGGEMGIGNTTAAAALACALLGETAQHMAGPGTGLNAAGVAHKADVIDRALEQHRAYLSDPYDALRRLGGFEIAALAGAFIACAQSGFPVLVDGFIATTAALTAERIRPGCAQWFFYAHTSAEPGHTRLLDALQARPLLSLDMRLGEGSGAALAMPLLRLACDLHNKMATFAEAAVQEKM